MKKYLFLLMVAFGITNAYAEGVVLSDTFVADNDTETVFEPQKTYSQPASNTYGGQHIYASTKDILSTDSTDPLFLVADNQFLSDTFINTVDKKIRLGEYLGYGINGNFMLHLNMFYQWDVSGNQEHGFSSTEIGGIYRMNNGFGTRHIISDVLFGLKVGGSEHVRTPEYADSSYFAGLRFGRQYTGVTLAGTVKSTWVFDDIRGLSFLDFIPEAYFRFQDDWRAGLGFDIRKSTNPKLLKNQEWMNFKLLRQYGNTQYIGHFGYEFEDKNCLFGFDVKILF